eukprot:scaffold10353_cov127-Isochrysis_galbana.AAC.7
MASARGLQCILAALLAASMRADGGAHEFEYAGAFQSPDPWYTLSLDKVGGAYADEHMAVVILPLEADPTKEAHFLTEFNRAPLTRSVLFDGAGATVVFEVELDEHDLDGEEHDHEDEEDLPWGVAIGAALIVCVTTLSGVFLLAPGLANFIRSYSLESVLQAFAAGALLSAAFLLLLFEATHLISESTSSETETVWQWGACVLGGFAICMGFDFVAGLMTKIWATKGPRSAPPEEADPKTIESAKVASAAEILRIRVVSGVLVGDALHNLCDGVFIGAAFLSCGNSFGWAVAGASIAHEVAQEISDFIVLTAPEQVRCQDTELPLTATCILAHAAQVTSPIDSPVLCACSHRVTSSR